ncbi:hypothetical protein ATCC90586_008905 [Pythium insidiosum]|nr:hypothetical protein ATCC90586_008905 [Pythium insidiosum]
MGFGTTDDRFPAARAAPRADDNDEEVSERLRQREQHDDDEEKRSVDGHGVGSTDDEQLQQLHGDLRHLVPVGRRLRGDAASDDAFSDDTDIEEEMMRIDPVDMEWRHQLHASDPIDAQNVFGNWCPASILRQIIEGDVHIRYLNMNESWHRWVPLSSGQLAPPATKTRNDSTPLRLAQLIEVRKPGKTMWTEAHVVKARPDRVMVRYAGRQVDWDEWIPFTPETVAPAGEHIRTRACSITRRLSVTPNVNRSRVIEAQNPRFQHYRQALAAQGLSIFSVEGDGNCLFRSVSHQIYGDDRHHGLVRRLCMDYMESEKEYFEPYVVGDMADFLRYLAHKRRDGVWGDDPEIQAMCELYDRPAEVYAYDPTHGFRKLRTFHDNSSLSRNRPPICLSYYGGGHYDSIVGPRHTQNIVREPPGELEARHIEYARRINTRELPGAGISQRATPSESADTEMAQLEHILMISRNEFDAMNSNLDETLRRALDESHATARDSEQRALDAAQRESEIAAIQAELLDKARHASEEELVRKAIEASLQEQSQALPADVAFDEQVTAAIQASLAEATRSSAPEGSRMNVDDEEEMRRILELSAMEYNAAFAADRVACRVDVGAEDMDTDEMDELQRAIQASLQDT